MTPEISDTSTVDIHMVTVTFTRPVTVVTATDRVEHDVCGVTFTWVRENGHPEWILDVAELRQLDRWPIAIGHRRLPQWVLDLESEFKPRNLTT